MNGKPDEDLDLEKALLMKPKQEHPFYFFLSKSLSITTISDIILISNLN